MKTAPRGPPGPRNKKKICDPDLITLAPTRLHCSKMAGTKDSGVGTTPQFLTAIDFGTTHCSVAYLLRPDETSSRNKVDPIVLKLDNAGRKRVPSCILFDNNGNKIAFGYEAREQFTSLNRKPISKTVKFFPEYHYFEHVKGHLQREKVTLVYAACVSI